MSFFKYKHGQYNSFSIFSCLWLNAKSTRPFIWRRTCRKPNCFALLAVHAGKCRQCHSICMSLKVTLPKWVHTYVQVSHKAGTCVTLMMHRIQVCFLAFMKSSYFHSSENKYFSCFCCHLSDCPFMGARRIENTRQGLLYSNCLTNYTAN